MCSNVLATGLGQKVRTPEHKEQRGRDYLMVGHKEKIIMRIRKCKIKMANKFRLGYQITLKFSL